MASQETFDLFDFRHQAFTQRIRRNRIQWRHYLKAWINDFGRSHVLVPIYDGSRSVQMILA
jgi:hypothetical protein